MAYYAFLDEHSIVTDVIRGNDETEGVDWETYYSNIAGQICKKTSFNAYAGVGFRKNFAGIGYAYDNLLDAFIPPKPFASWLLNTTTCQWDAPIPAPNFDTTTQQIYWDEATLSWIIKNII
jgi:hypothetical protein